MSKSILKKPAESVVILFGMVVLHSNPSILCEIEQALALKEELSIHYIIKPYDVAFCPINRENYELLLQLCWLY